jgi:hypothetical protein
LTSFAPNRSSKHCPFGVHHLASYTDQPLAAPSIFNMDSVCAAAKRALAHSLHSNKLLHQVKLYVAADSTLHKQDVLDLCLDAPDRATSPAASADSHDADERWVICSFVIRN